MAMIAAGEQQPGGLAQAFLIGRRFIGRDSAALVLGDNIFHGHDLVGLMKGAAKRKKGVRGRAPATPLTTLSGAKPRAAKKKWKT